MAAAVPVLGGAITADGSYHEFFFGGVGSFASTCGGTCTATTNPLAEQVSSSPWTFSGAANLFVLDLFAKGDEFTILDNSVSIGSTSIVASGAAPCGGDIACAIGDAGYSRGLFALGAGSHSITIQVLAANGTFGNAVFSASSSAPEPSTLSLFGAGVAALALVRRKLVRR